MFHLHSKDKGMF